MAKDDVILSVGADTSSADKALKSFNKQATSALGGIEKSFNTITTLAIGFAGVIAGRQVIRAFEAVAEAAAIQEKAVAQLNTALKLSGDFSESASQQMQDFATSLQATSTVGDEVVLQQLALAKSFGITNEQAQKLVKAAVDLSAATGISLDSAVKNLGKSFSGLTGELGEILPAVKAFSVEQNKAGAVLDFVTNRFGGAAQQLTKTFSGSVEQARNTFGDFLETLGEFITSNPLVVEGINLFSKGITQLITTIKQNSGEIQAFVNQGLVAIVNTIPTLIRSFAFIGRAFEGVSLGVGLLVTNLSQLISAFLRLDFTKALFEAISDSVNVFISVIVGSVGKLLEFINILPGASKAASAFGFDLDETAKSLKEFADAATVGEDLTATLENNAKALDGIAASSITTTDSVSGFFKDFQKGASVVGELADDIAKKIGNIAGKAKEAGKAAAEMGPKEQAKSFFDFVQDLDFSGAFTSLSKSISGAFKDGADSIDKVTKSFVASIFGGDEEKKTDVAETDKKKENEESKSAIVEGFALGAQLLSSSFVQSIGNVISNIGNIPQQFLDAFNNLDSIISSLIDQFPQIFERFIDELPKIVDKIVDALPKLVDSLVKALPRIAAALGDAFLEIFDVILKELPKIIDALPEILNEFISRIPEAFAILLRRLPAIITSIFDAIPQILRSILQALPQIAIEFANNIGPIVVALTQGIIEAIPEIIFVLVDELITKGGIFRIAAALVEGLVLGTVAIAQGIIRGFGSQFEQLGDDLFKGFSQAFGGLGPFFENFAQIFSNGIKFPQIEGPDFLQKLQTILTEPPFLGKLREILENIGIKVPGGGGGGGGLGSILTGGLSGGGGGFGGFATGGVVPAGFPNDNFIAGLTSGELVIPRGDVARLSDFLDQQVGAVGGSQAPALSDIIDQIDRATQKNVTVNLRVGEQDLANIQLNLARQGFRTA